MFVFQWQSETVDDRAQYFQQFCNAIVMLSLVDEPIENIVYLLPYEGSQSQKFTINSVQRRF